MEDTSVNILAYILDDEVDVHDIMKEMLAEYGIKEEKTKFFEDPELFIEALTTDISITVIDHRLPGFKTGLDYIKRIKQKNKYSFLIVMSGQRSFDVGVRYLNEGADKYIDKNWEQKDLYEILGPWDKQRPPSYLDVFVKFLSEGFKEAEERVRIVKFLERKLS